MLAKVLGIRPEERRDTYVAFGTLVAILCAHSMLETARDALFLAKLPPEQLPLAYIAIALCALVASKANQAATARFSRRKLLSISLALGGVVTLIFYQLTEGRGAITLGALYVWTGLLATVVVVQFWLQLGDVLSVTQAKRVFSIIGAGGLVGATLGSGAASALLSYVDARVLLLISGSMFVVAAVMPLGFSRANTEEAPRRRARVVPPTQQTALKEIAGDAYLKRLFLMVLVGALMVTGVDYVFKARVVAAADLYGWDLGIFFGRFYAVINAISLVVQLVLAPRLMRLVGVNRALLLMPGLLLLGSLGFALTIALAPVLILKGTDGVLRHSVHRTASEILFLPLQRRVRERFKGFAEAVGQRGGQALASLIILGVTALTSDARLISAGLVLLAGAWVVTMIGLQPHYLELFRKQLRAGALDTEVDVPDLDLASFETLVSALSSEDDDEVLAALDMFEQYGKTGLVPALILYHPSRAVVMRAFDIFAQHGRSDVTRLAARLLKHDDVEIRAAALRTLAAIAPDEALLRKHLEDASPPVRLTALVALVGGGFVDDGEATTTIREMIGGHCQHTRLALARALRHLPAARFDWVAEELARSAGPHIAAEIARSVSEAPDEHHVPMLIGMLQLRDARQHARRALRLIGEPALEQLAASLADQQLPRMLRRHLPRTISRFENQRAADILVDALADEHDDRVVFKILRGLGRMRVTHPNISVDRDRMLAMTEHTMKGAITQLHWRLAVGRVIDMKQEVMTPAAEILLAYLDEKWALSLQRVFRLLHIMEPTQEFRIIYEGLKSEDAKSRDSSRELLSHVVPDALREGILALVDDAPPERRLEAARVIYDPPGRQLLGHALARLANEGETHENLRELGLIYADHLRDMLADRSEALRSIVAHHVRELGMDELIAEVREAAGHSSDVLGEVADRALGLFSIHPNPELSGAS